MTSDQKTPPPLGESSREAIENLPPLEASRDAESSGAVVSELVEALKAIDAMPRYTAPVPPEWVSGLLARYHKALDLAEAALSKAVQS